MHGCADDTLRVPMQNIKESVSKFSREETRGRRSKARPVYMSRGMGWDSQVPEGPKFRSPASYI